MGSLRRKKDKGLSEENESKGIMLIRRRDLKNDVKFPMRGIYFDDIILPFVRVVSKFDCDVKRFLFIAHISFFGKRIVHSGVIKGLSCNYNDVTTDSILVNIPLFKLLIDEIRSKL